MKSHQHRNELAHGVGGTGGRERVEGLGREGGTGKGITVGVVVERRGGCSGGGG